MGKKKGGAFVDLPDLDEEEAAAPPAAAPESAPASKGPAAGGKKKKGKDKKGKAAAFDSDEDEVTQLTLPAAEEEEPEVVPVKPKAGKAKGKAKPAAKASFAALGLGDEEEEEEEEATAQPTHPADDEDEANGEVAPPKQLTIAEVVSVAPHPKAADKLRVCEVSVGHGLRYKVVTNALNVKRDMKVVYAPLGVLTATGIRIEQRTLKGVDSYGMLCSAADIGWTDKADGVLVVMPENAVVGAPAPVEPPEELGITRHAKSASPPLPATATAEDEAPAGLAAGGGSKQKQKKGKGKDAGSLFAALEEADGNAAAAEEIPAADKKSKKGKKGKDAASLFAALEEDGEAAPEPEAEPEVEPPAASKKDKKKGSAGAASLFAALEENGDAAPAAGGAEVEEEEEPALGGKKKKKGSKAAASLFAALEADGGAPTADGAEEDMAGAVPKEELKEKKKKKKGADALFAALEEEAAGAAAAPETSPAEGLEVEEAPAPKKDKKKKKKDMDGLLAALEEEGAAPPPPEPEAAPAPEPAAQPSGSAKGKPGKAKAAAADPELDALLAELEAPKPAQPAAAAAGAGGKKKKKGKGGKEADKEDEDIDALLAALDGPKQAPAAAATAEPATSSAAPAAAPAAAATTATAEAPKAADEDDEGEGGEDLEALAAAGKELTAAQKKKLKKKQKEKEKKAAAKAEAEGGEEAAAAAAAAAPAKGGKPVKESAMARKIREELERRQKAEEAARAAEEARRAAEEAELRRLEEEEARKAEERRLKKEREKAKREQLKKEGKLLTGKAKAEAERLAAMRAQLLKQAEEKGIILDTTPSSSDAAAQAEAAEAAAAAAAEADKQPKKKVVYHTKKQLQQKKKEEEAAKAKEEEEARLKAEEEEVARKAAEAQAATTAAAAAPQQQQEAEAAPQADAADDWEEAADDWEAIDLDAVKTPLSPAASGADEVKAAAAPAPTAAAKPAAARAPASAAQPAAAAAAAAVKKPAEKLAQKPDEEEEDGTEEDEEESGSPATGEESEEESEGEESGSESGSEEGSGSEEESSEEESDSEEESEEESDSDEDDSSEYSMDSEEQREMRIEAAREKRLARAAVARKNAIKEELRSPICCILGHVDVGKTKILDNIRRTNVQEGEAGGITQQIGATFVPGNAIERRTESLRSGRTFDMKLPGLLVIDTPGHESFTNLRARGSGLCDIAVLIVDLMHGLEQQTIESINLLKMRKTPFIIALNKIDRLYGWKSAPDAPVRDCFKRQKDFVMTEFEQRSSQVFLQLNEQGLNVSLYWKNPDPRKYVNVVPTSAMTGEGIPDLLQLMVKLTQTMMQDRLMYVDNTECTVLEVKNMEGLGTTVDCVLVNGKLREGDRVVVCGLGGPIVTRIKALKTPQVLREMRVKGALMDHKEIRAAMGVKIVAPGLEQAVAGTSMYVIGPEDDEEELKDAVMSDMADIFSKVDKGGEGVCVQASTLGSLEALLTFLASPEVNIPVSGINIGPVHKKDVLRANVMNEKGAKKYAVILAFDVNVAKEARELSEEFGVKIFTADIIYHLFDQFTAYVKQFKQAEQEAARFVAVFPCVLKIIPTCIFNKKDPIVLGVEVAEGIAKVGTPLCVPTQEGIDLGRIASMELNHKAVDVARAGQSVAMKIESTNTTEQSRLYGRHFDFNDALVSRITRESIDALKQHFQDEMTKDDWRLVIKLKKTFQIN